MALRRREDLPRHAVVVVVAVVADARGVELDLGVAGVHDAPRADAVRRVAGREDVLRGPLSFLGRRAHGDASSLSGNRVARSGSVGKVIRTARCGRWKTKR